MQSEQSFAEQFKKYRLRSQITTLAEFANLLAEEGMVYENSLFSRWQSGDRTPHDRKTLLSVITVFAKQGGIRNTEQANEILASAEQLPLTSDEQEQIHPYINTNKSSANELVEFEKVEMIESGSTVDVLNLTMSALNHALANHNELRIFAILEAAGSKLQKIQINKAFTFLFTIYFALFAWWISIQMSGETSTMNNFGFATFYPFLPITGGLFGFGKSIRWGGVKSSMGKAIFYLSVGLESWGIGQFIWAYYVLVLHVEVPYPAYSDIFFILSWPLWGLGVHNLSKAAGIRFQLTKRNTKLKLIFIPLLMIAVSYYLLIVVARSGILITSGEIFAAAFDLLYPVMDAILLTQIILVFGLTYHQLQRKYKVPLTLIFVGIIANYFADFLFAYATTNDSFYNANYVDMLFVSSLFVLSCAVNSFDVS